MTNILRGLIAGPACVVFGVTAYAGGSFGIICVGAWQGAAYTNDKGAFSDCTTVGKLEKGPAVILAENAYRTWIIGGSERLAKVSGSGFVVSKNAHVVTNNHVVAECVGDIQGNLAGQAP